MYDSDYGSTIFDTAVQAFMLLPSVGRRTAQRYALHLLARPREEQMRFVEAIGQLASEMKYCPQCHGLSDTGQPCSICADPQRERTQVCVVADIRDVLAIERAGLYHGRYFILGGLIDPMAGVGPEQLPVAELIALAGQSELKEVILAFTASLEGETTTFYLQKRLEPLGVTISIPARGIPFGETIEQTDDLTLSRAFTNRTTLFSPKDKAHTAKETATSNSTHTL